MGHWTSIFSTIHASMEAGLKAQAESAKAQAPALGALVERMDVLSTKFHKKSRSARAGKTTEQASAESHNDDGGGDDADDESDAAEERDPAIVRLQVGSSHESLRPSKD